VGVVRSVVLFCSVPKAAPERKDARSYVNAVRKEQTGPTISDAGDVMFFMFPSKTHCS
jgi:hypothetical protein